MTPNEAICSDHGMKSYELVSLNSKQEPVYRCKGNDLTPPKYPHYFTVETEAKERLAKAASEQKKKRR